MTQTEIMKTKITLLVAFLAAFFMGFAQQPPNGGFENFSDPYTPTGWIGIEDLSQNAIGLQNSIFTFQDSTTFTEGAASLKLVTDTIPFYYQLVGILPGLASLGTGSLDNQFNPTFVGIPFTYRPDSIIFDYKYTTPGGDTAAVNLKLTKQDTVIIFGRGVYLLPDSNWVHMSISLTALYNTSDTPESLLLQFVSSNPNANPVIGSTLHVDGVRFGYINQPVQAGINELASARFSVYPNPASSLLNITSTVNLESCSVQMFDLLGRIVLTQPLTNANNVIDIAKLAGGTYIYRITDKDNSLVSQNKFTVVK